MMAVRCGQELDLLKDLQVRPYIEDLLRASHPYWTETSTVTCDNIDTCTNKEYCSEDGSECFSDDKLCSHGHTVRHRDYDLEPKTDPDTGKITYVKKWGGWLAYEAVQTLRKEQKCNKNKKEDADNG